MRAECYNFRGFPASQVFHYGFRLRFRRGAIVLTVYFIVVYNGFIFLRENVRRNWSNIDVLLVQRHDELPKLVEACKGYMRHERETLEGVMRARSAIDRARTSADLDALGDAETSLRSDLGRLFALAENYPELKASESFLKLQRRITELEESIADRRELYNDSVNTNNIRIDQFPQLIVAVYSASAKRTCSNSPRRKRPMSTSRHCSPDHGNPRLTEHLRSLSDFQFALVTAIAVVVAIFCLYVYRRMLHHTHLAADTPTSKIRSASQG